MIETDLKFQSLSNLLDHFQKRGKICFTKKEITSLLNMSPVALKLALHRQSLKKRIVRVRKDFYVIISIEYQDVGSPPPEWFIDQLMAFLKADYYVGLLSAAALQGAAHQQPMMFQVVTELKNPRDIKLGRTLIHFVSKNKIIPAGVITKKSVAGYFKVSGPELTLYDLVRYPSSSGQLNNIATIVAELMEDVNSEKLVEIAKSSLSKRGEFIYWQRLGYIMDFVGGKSKSKLLANWIAKNKVSPGYLARSGSERTFAKSDKWNLYINSELEPDL